MSVFDENNDSCRACSDPDCPCSCCCGMCPVKDYSFYDEEPDVDELQENQDFAQDDDYQDYGDVCDD